MHNTQWVPGHFHFYLLLGVLPMILALLYHVIGSRAPSTDEILVDRLGLASFALGAAVAVGSHWMRILRTLLASAVLLLAGGVAFAVLTDGYTTFTTESARRLKVQTQRPQMPAVALETQAGERIDLMDLRGRWLVVDFIYTHCQSYCLALGAEFTQLQDLLAAPLASGDILLLSVSFDPQYDTPKQLTRYLHRFGDHLQGWLAARPVTAGDLQRIKQAFGVIVISDGLGGYEHNASLQIVDTQGRLVGILDRGEAARIPGLLFPGARK